MSLPSLEAWIETRSRRYLCTVRTCRFLHWKRGLKQRPADGRKDPVSRFLHWKRGLKLPQKLAMLEEIVSLPSLEAWIETNYFDAGGCVDRVASFIGSVD